MPNETNARAAARASFDAVVLSINDCIKKADINLDNPSSFNNFMKYVFSLRDTFNLSGAKRGSPIEFYDALELNNPNFLNDDEYKKNYGACLVSFEARLRGYNVEPLAIDFEKEYKETKIFFKNPEIIIQNFDSYEAIISFLEENVCHNERYILEFKRNSKIYRSHAFCVFINNYDELAIIDPQSSLMYTEDTMQIRFLSDYSDLKEEFIFYRIDDLDFDMKLSSKVVKKSDVEVARDFEIDKDDLYYNLDDDFDSNKYLERISKRLPYQDSIKLSHKERRIYFEEYDYLLYPDYLNGHKKGKPDLDYKAVDIVNKKYSKGRNYQINCTMCVAAFEARMRGYDVVAAPFDPNCERFTLARVSPNRMFISPITRKNPIETSDSFLDEDGLLEFLKNNVLVGNRYILIFCNRITAHVVSIYNKGHNIYIADPQIGRIYNADSLVAVYIGYENIIQTTFSLIRIDNLAFNINFIKDMLKANKSKIN